MIKQTTDRLNTMRTTSLLILVAVFATAVSLAQDQSPVPRAIHLPDTLGANFDVKDTLTGTSAPTDYDFLLGTWTFTFQPRRPDGTFPARFRAGEIVFPEPGGQRMRFMREHQRPALLALLSLALIFGGCASGGIFGGDDEYETDGDYEDDGGYDRDSDRDRDDFDRVREVRGRVDRVDTSSEIIYVEASDVYRSQLRNGGDDDELRIYYDDRTEVEYQGSSRTPPGASALAATVTTTTW